MYIPWNWEIGSVLAKLRNFGEEFESGTPFGTPLKISVREYRLNV
jgi:hypothetical protein